MVKRVKNIFCIMIIFMVSLGVVGCGSTEQKVEVEESTEVVNNAMVLEEIPKDYKGTLTMWGWDDTYFKTITKAFNEIYPNVTFEYTPVANGDLLQKYQTALATGTELPDIAWAIVDSRAKVFELDMWEVLNEAPYNFEKNQVFDYLHPLMVNTAGDICGIEQGINTAGIAYRRDLTKKYLGTDDPKELEGMLSTWDEFIEVGKKVYEESNGEVYMWPGIGDAQQFIREQGGQSWIEGDTVNVTEALGNSMYLATAFRDAGIVDKIESWTPAWYASFGEDKYMFAGCATWSVPFVIEANDPKGKETGHWGLMSAPEGNISWGGTTLGISKTSQEKALAWEFIKFATLSTEGAEALNSIGIFTSAKEPYEQNSALKSFKSPWFGEQDLGRYYLEEIMPLIQVRPMNVEDNVVHNALNLVTTTLINDGEITAEKAIELLKEEIQLSLLEYKVE